MKSVCATCTKEFQRCPNCGSQQVVVCSDAGEPIRWGCYNCRAVFTEGVKSANTVSVSVLMCTECALKFREDIGLPELIVKTTLPPIQIPLRKLGR